MFEAEVRATFAAQARAMADQFNQIKLDDYLGACRNWAIRANGPPPVVPLGFVAEVEFEPVFVLRIVAPRRPFPTSSRNPFCQSSPPTRTP